MGLSILKSLSDRLLDIHSQHETLLLKDAAFQLESLDAYAANTHLLGQYRQAYSEWQQTRKKLDALREEEARMKSELDFFRFQYDELEKAGLREGEKTELEEELNKLSHAEELKSTLTQVSHLLSEGDENLIQQLTSARNLLSKIASLSADLDRLYERLGSTVIELKDISAAVYDQAREAEFDPERQQLIEDRLDQIYSLESKHRVGDEAALIRLMYELEEKIRQATSVDNDILQLEALLQVQLVRLQSLADELRISRTEAATAYQKDILATLKVLGMPDAMIHILVEPLEQFTINGKDAVKYLFSANKGIEAQELRKVASGGEISRFMLAVKAIVSSKKELATIIFDEIDTGVSGAIADKLGLVMERMATHCQIICITHLPQIASKGDLHLKVKKTTRGGITRSGIAALNENERIEEVAVMLSGAEITREALENAKVLLRIQ